MISLHYQHINDDFPPPPVDLGDSNGSVDQSDDLGRNDMDGNVFDKPS